MGDNEHNEQFPSLIENPFIKPENRQWSISLPASLDAPVSPPRPRKRIRTNAAPEPSTLPDSTEAVDANARAVTESSSNVAATDVAAIEAGRVSIENHLEVLSASLLQATRPPIPAVPRLPHDESVALYKRNQHAHGRHFVIHQHDHPVAGPHYDLRLQFSETSSVSFAIMYGLPGDPNSRRLNRNATETRVHTVWSHLIESASASTGSLLIWDTGEYSILPYYATERPVETDHSDSAASSELACDPFSKLTDSEKLHIAFQQQKIRLRLHGSRLPQNYTVRLGLTKSNHSSEQPKRPIRKRRKKSSTAKRTRDSSTETSDESSGKAQHPAQTPADSRPITPAATHSDADEDETIRQTNAYPGASNSIASVHQRTWYLSFDRENSGFEKQTYLDGPTRRKRWVRKKSDEVDGDGNLGLLGFDPFYVRGPDVERSVVTGRLGRDVLDDQGVKGFVGRRGWRPVLE